MKDYYDILGVPRSAGQDEIKKSFRALARDTHPDANPGDPAAEARFREIAEAYEVLGDTERRARYDRGESFGADDLFSQFGGLDDILQQFFGATFGGFGFGGSRSGPRRGPDVTLKLPLTLEEAAFGTSREIGFIAPTRCERCTGSGAEPGHAPKACPTCGGRGKIQVARATILGSMMTIRDCTECAGSGHLIEHPCSECAGVGRIQSERSLNVEVPKGVEDGTRLRLAGRGGSGERGAPPGDVYVQIAVAPDDRFQRDDDDLHHRVEIGLGEATFGTAVDVPLLDGGMEHVELPAAIQPETVIRLPKLGVPRLQRRGRGDLYVHVAVVVPDDLTQEQEDALRRFADLRGEQPAERRRGLFRR